MANITSKDVVLTSFGSLDPKHNVLFEQGEGLLNSAWGTHRNSLESRKKGVFPVTNPLRFLCQLKKNAFHYFVWSIERTGTSRRPCLQGQPFYVCNLILMETQFRVWLSIE